MRDATRRFEAETARPVGLAADRTHTALRVAAVAVLLAVCVWPRARSAPQLPRVDTAAEVTGAKRAPSPPRHVKLASTSADDSVASR